MPVTDTGEIQQFNEDLSHQRYLEAYAAAPQASKRRLAEINRRKRTLAEAEQKVADSVALARQEQIPWALIGPALGVAPQSAWRKWKWWWFNDETDHAEQGHGYVPGTDEERQLG